jgi:hypothetical protein
MVAYTASGSYTLARTRTGYHKGRDEACDIQIGFPVKVKLVVNELVGWVGGDTLLWKSVLGDGFNTSISGGVWSRNTVVNAVVAEASIRTTDSDNFLGVDMLSVSMTSGCPLPCGGP